MLMFTIGDYRVAFENRNDVTSVIVSKEVEAEIIEWTRSLSDFSNLTEPYDEQVFFSNSILHVSVAVS